MAEDGTDRPAFAGLSIKQVANRRDKNWASTRKLSPDYEAVGVAGEVFISNLIGLPLNPKSIDQPDPGFEFSLDLKMTIDVKTFKKPYNLLVEEGKVRCTIYILCGINPNGECYYVGWMWGRKLITAPTKDFGKGVIDHYISAERLYSLDKLKDLITVLQFTC